MDDDNEKSNSYDKCVTSYDDLEFIYDICYMNNDSKNIKLKLQEKPNNDHDVLKTNENKEATATTNELPPSIEKSNNDYSLLKANENKEVTTNELSPSIEKSNNNHDVLKTNENKEVTKNELSSSIEKPNKTNFNNLDESTIKENTVKNKSNMNKTERVVKNNLISISDTDSISTDQDFINSEINYVVNTNSKKKFISHSKLSFKIIDYVKSRKYSSLKVNYHNIDNSDQNILDDNISNHCLEESILSSCENELHEYNETSYDINVSNAKEIVEEVNNFNHNEHNFIDKPPKRFFLTHNYGIIHMNDVQEFEDFKKRDLFDKCKKINSRGIYSNAWIKLRHSIFSCYKTSKILKDENFISNKYIFIDPADNKYFHNIKYSINLVNAEFIFLLKILQDLSWYFVVIMI